MPSAEASRRNLEKAFTSPRFHRPLPWRSPRESHVIKRLAWQWFAGEEPRCPLRELARLLGVSQAYIQKLVRQFKVNPPRELMRVVRGYGGFSVSASGRFQKPRVLILTTFGEFQEVREQSERMRERGYLRATFKGMFYQFPGTPEISKKNRTS
jgi:hypothetical protein